MAIAKMSKLRIIGMLQDKDQVLNEVAKSGKCHIKESEEIKGIQKIDNAEEILLIEKVLSRTEASINALGQITEDGEQNECNYKTFLAQENMFDANMLVVDEVTKLLDEIAKNSGIIKKCKKEKYQMVPIELRKLTNQTNKTSNVKQTKSAETIRTILEQINKLLPKDEEEEDIEDIAFIATNNGLKSVYEVDKQTYESLSEQLASLKECLEIKETKAGTIELYFSFKYLGNELCALYENKIKELDARIREYENKNIELFKQLRDYTKNLSKLKLFCDYVRYKLSKLKKEQYMQKTDSTFTLECYVEKKEVESFINAMEDKFDSLIIKNQKITSKDNPPTKIVGSKITKQADFVVNMYSVPNYHDVDPTWSVFVFFMVFFGFIVADIGYGIVLCIIGFILANKKSLSTGARKLWKLIGTAGIFTIIWGFLFGSVFGFSTDLMPIFPNGIMPDPQASPIELLLICMLMGICQIAFGYLLRGINYFKHGKIMAGLVHGVAWVLFLVGMVMAAAKFMTDFFALNLSAGFANVLQAIQTPGLIIMIVGLAFGVILAGIGTKGFTKFTKSFSALYGIINLFSDILSYARLFGLMLSGAIIGQQFNEIALSIMTSPIGYIFGFIIMLIGHSFNIAMGALGAYIHDTRLQYVEYFGKFYTGEGELFEPFSVEQKYTKIYDLGEI